MMDDKLKKMTLSAAKPDDVKKTRTEFMDRIEKIDRDTGEQVERIKKEGPKT